MLSQIKGVGTLPNLILCGPPGTGTLTIAIVVLTWVVFCAQVKLVTVLLLKLTRLEKSTLSTLGKTTSVHALARELLGSYYKDAVLELNASDARGIDVRFRSKVLLHILVCQILSNIEGVFYVMFFT